MIDVDRLVQAAQELVVRVRDDDPEANQRWLHATTSAEEREALLYVLAAAVPDDRTWRQLTLWTEQERPQETPQARRRRYQREWARRHRAQEAA